jgi:SEC-C motif-containing protein
MHPSRCPCQSQASYAQCCQLLHRGQPAATAAQLMRARYTAYVLHLIDFVVQTTLPAQQGLLDQTAIRQWSESTDWCGLELLQQWPKVGKQHAQVEFKAYYLTAQGREYHHEKSTFVRIDQHWYFLDPTTDHRLSQKQPCFCGSGKKFKQCCGVFL